MSRTSFPQSRFFRAFESSKVRKQRMSIKFCTCCPVGSARKSSNLRWRFIGFANNSAKGSLLPGLLLARYWWRHGSRYLHTPARAENGTPRSADFTDIHHLDRQSSDGSAGGSSGTDATFTKSDENLAIHRVRIGSPKKLLKRYHFRLNHSICPASRASRCQSRLSRNPCGMLPLLQWHGKHWRFNGAALGWARKYNVTMLVPDQGLRAERDCAAGGI